ncbi:hypothetical protein OIY81_3101 [Cryptosporidium canis]|uniref:SART-1 family protein n=1 Tax=Cryptosporidium canis TaxID=195482 RepID=A0ABQ8P2N5_9CRYT|nr:hypothetical protein OJ252_3335 [Cryptosporidium canis]KAJ1606783.1 hypothetical protein OIY81_3101 [Cryptosporidium canis]
MEIMSTTNNSGNYKQGEIVTFEDKHILEYKDDDDYCNRLDNATNSKNINAQSGSNRNDSEPSEKAPKTKFKFKRTKIDVIKRSLRNEPLTENLDNEETDTSSYQLTNFNSNFLTNNSSIFDDTDVFYDRLKIQKKRKILQQAKDEFESIHVAENYRSGLVNEKNPNSDSSIFLSLETEFCRKINNENSNDIGSRSTINNIVKANNDFVTSDPKTNKSDHIGKINIYNPQTTTSTSETNISNADETDHLNSANVESNNHHKNILHEEPLDFGIASTLELLKNRGKISSNKNELNATRSSNTDHKSDHSTTELDRNLDFDNQISIFHTDDNGNILNSKEAFKRLCWKFHGQKVNKNKIEKMLRSYIRNKT